MSAPWRHHFVPQLLLREFADEDGKIFTFSKRDKPPRIRSGTAKYVHWEEHCYSTVDAEGQKDPSLEFYFQKIEDAAGPVVKKIVHAARSHALPRLSRDEKKIWDYFLCYQYKRVPDLHFRVVSDGEFEEEYNASLDRYESEVRALTSAERAFYNDPQTRQRIGRNALVESLYDAGPMAMSVLDQRGLGVVRIGIPNKSFVIGSLPVIKLTSPGITNLAHDSVEMWLPIAHDVAVTPCGTKDQERLSVLTNNIHIRALNLHSFKQSTSIAGRSSSLIESLASSR